MLAANALGQASSLSPERYPGSSRGLGVGPGTDAGRIRSHRVNQHFSESPETVGNANITFTYSTPAATVSSTNWAGIYQPGQVPGQVGSITYVYAPQPSGTVTISASSLDGVGQYQAYYLYKNGYQQVAGPVDFTVVGEPPAPAPRVVRVFSPEGQAGLDDPFCGGRGRPGRRMGGRHGQQPAGRVLLLMGRSSMTGAAQARGPASSITPLP
jgi:hypothetical protein